MPDEACDGQNIASNYQVNCWFYYTHTLVVQQTHPHIHTSTIQMHAHMHTHTHAYLGSPGREPRCWLTGSVHAAPQTPEGQQEGMGDSVWVWCEGGVMVVWCEGGVMVV